MNESRTVVTDDVVAEVEFLARSANRVEILKCLLDRETVDRRDLAEECDVVRTTLQRNLDSLVEADLLHQPGPRTYELTAIGEELARSLVEFVETAHAARRLAPLLKWLPNGAFDLEVRALADAELVVSEPTDPYATVNRHVEALRGAETFRATLPVVGQRAAETAYERIVETDGEFEVVVGPETAETLRNDPAYEDVIADLFATDDFRLFVSEDPIPFYLGLVDVCVQIGVEDDEGMPRALVESEAAAVREWAEETYAAYRDDTVQVS